MVTTQAPRRVRRSLAFALACMLVGGAALLLGPRIAGSQPPGPPATTLAVTAPSPASSVGPSPVAAATATATATATVAPSPTVGPVPTALPDPAVPEERPSATLPKRLTLDQQLDRLRWRAGMPGISAAIIFPDGSTWVGQSGLADVAAAVAVRTDTVFAIGSVTKTFTAAVILDLVEDDLIDLDERVRTYLPDLDIPMDGRTTVRQLLDHTSGLRDYFFHPRIDRALLADRDATWSASRTLRFVGATSFRAGTGWSYSNTNYFVLGLLAEAVSGESLADLLRTRFFVPLGLRDTVYQPDGPADGPVAHGYRFAAAGRSAPPIDLSDGTSVVPFSSVVTAAGAAGGMASSALDVARWARALYSGQALQPASLGAMLGAIERTDRVRPRIPYGLGVQAVPLDGRPTYGHSGRLLGARSVVRHLPAEGITIAVLTNQSRSDPAVTARELVRIALRPIERCTCSGRE